MIITRIIKLHATLSDEFVTKTELILLTREFLLLQHQICSGSGPSNREIKLLLKCAHLLVGENNKFDNLLTSFNILQKAEQLIILLDNDDEKHEIAIKLYFVLYVLSYMVGAKDSAIEACQKALFHYSLAAGKIEFLHGYAQLHIRLALLYIDVGDKYNAKQTLQNYRWQRALDGKDDIFSLQFLEGLARSAGVPDHANGYQSMVSHQLSKPYLVRTHHGADNYKLRVLNAVVEQAHKLVRGSSNDCTFRAEYPDASFALERIEPNRSPDGITRSVVYLNYDGRWEKAYGELTHARQIYFYNDTSDETFKKLSLREQEIIETIALTKQSRIGNCAALSYLVVYILAQMPIFKAMNIYMVSVEEYDHVFLAIDLNKDNIHCSPDEWGCLIVDPWRPGNRDGRYVFHSSELMPRLKRMLPILSKNTGSSDGEGLSFMLHHNFEKFGEYVNLVDDMNILPSDIEPESFHSSREEHEQSYRSVIKELDLKAYSKP